VSLAGLIAIAIHGGAGTMRRADLPPEREALYRDGLAAALEAGHAVLREGGAALDAVQAAVLVLEDDPLFNAGRGAVFNDQGFIELEAAMMDGSSRRAGSVTGLRRVRHPVLAARLVMERTPHVTLGFEAAEAFAREQGLALEPEAWFRTEQRWNALQAELQRRQRGESDLDVSEDRKHGTVGAVALDAAGRLAAATSTGGRTGKMAGRIGDTPVIGAGTWADGRVAVSGTGLGEAFVRCAAAHDVAARMAYAGADLHAACDAVVMQELPRIGGTGGVIAVDAAGNVAMPFNCEGMYRAAVDGAGRRVVAIYR
jgi:beta-aspartyl-peptidase (threonine type)